MLPIASTEASSNKPARHRGRDVTRETTAEGPYPTAWLGAEPILWGVLPGLLPPTPLRHLCQRLSLQQQHPDHSMSPEHVTHLRSCIWSMLALERSSPLGKKPQAMGWEEGGTPRYLQVGGTSGRVRLGDPSVQHGAWRIGRYWVPCGCCPGGPPRILLPGERSCGAPSVPRGRAGIFTTTGDDRLS